MTSNLLPLSILAAICLIVFFATFVRVRFVKPNWIMFGIGAVLLAVVVVGVIQIIRNPAGQVETVDEEEHDGPLPEIPKTALERLRLDWNSQNVANWSASETLADISEIAYQPPHEAERSYQALGFTQVMPVVQGSMIGYVITGENVTVVAFRGTDFSEVSDWIANLGRSATDTQHGQVHKGFYFAYQSMKQQVDAILTERDTTKLWVTGHSLGGALALMCAYDLEEIEHRRLNGIITFGQPMVAQQEFADYIDTLLIGRYARFVNRDDIVPKIPSSHVACGSLVWFTDNGVKRSKFKRVLYGAANPNEAPVGDAGGEDEAEIKPLTDAEFEALQAKLKAENAEAERLPEGTPIVTYQAAASSLVDDHSMWLYLDKIRTLLGVNAPEEPQ
ncbi:lipase family protein [Polystyrenella longa]|uniref:lipase family protein n=1 Tax=Polystyrenella longa TaxID=2528007 RepID=UPI0018D25D61|nr:Mbeg1-like protein [Polystyrenella longa]